MPEEKATDKPIVDTAANEKSPNKIFLIFFVIVFSPYSAKLYTSSAVLSNCPGPKSLDAVTISSETFTISSSISKYCLLIIHLSFFYTAAAWNRRSIY
jgi:hypothetical protein